jgi:hypothetical protein
MLKQDAFSFGKAISDLWLMETICDRSADLQMDEEQVCDTRQKVHEVLQDISRVCAGSDLEDRIGPEIRRFQSALEKEPLKDIAYRCDHLRERILDELKKELYFHVFHSDTQYYRQRAPFGDAVTRKFEAATEEIEQAGNCLALRQPTACVFHLMRGMETAVQRLAKRLRMTISPQTTWRQLTGNMDAQISNMPQQTKREKQKKNNWEAARVNLHHLGSVLRNNTMHPTAVYTQEEAKHIFNAVGVSMRTLCDL